LFVSGIGMGGLFFVVGGVLGWGGVGGKRGQGGNGGGDGVEDKSKAMAAMLYLYVCFYSM
jgi:hypothetical protein